MVEIKESQDAWSFETALYRLSVPKNNPYRAKLFSGADQLLADLFIPSSCDSPERKDRCAKVDPPTITRSEDGVLVQIEARSSLWDRKTYCLRLTERNVEYYYVVFGKGAVGNCRFFEGFLVDSDKEKAFTTEFSSLSYERPLKEYSEFSVPGFNQVFNPHPNQQDKQFYREYESCAVSVQGIFSPSPFCFALGRKDSSEYASLGLAAREGEYNFVRYEYLGGDDAFGLNLTYEGYTEVEGEWETPHVVFGFSNGDEYAAIENYVKWLVCNEYVDVRKTDIHDWWFEPIFCGFGEQMYHEVLAGQYAQTYATQSCYEHWLAILEARGLNPGTIVIDDKWQNSYNDPDADIGKWPDLRGFIDDQHAKGRRVLLWIPAWNTNTAPIEDVPADECVTRDGQPMAVDPTNPKYEKRLRNAVRRMLSGDPGCLNADGFKIDFTGGVPTGPRIETCRPIRGTELLRRLIGIIHSQAKAVKTDALVMTHCVNPYFAQVTDVLRLNDIFTDRISVVSKMTHRAKIAHIACPDAGADTDCGLFPSRKAWLEYMETQPKIGIPSLYYATHIVKVIGQAADEIRREDYEQLERIWRDYRSQLAARR